MPITQTLSRTLALLLACLTVTVLATPVHAQPKVLTGLDVLQRNGFTVLKGKKVGLITNHSGINRTGEHVLDLMHASPNVELVWPA